MVGHLSNPWNNAVSFLTIHFRDQLISTGSGFFWRANDRTYLVTNWHNLAGRNPLTSEPLSKTCAIPDRIKFMAYRRVSEPDPAGFFELQWVPIELDLYQNDLVNPRWFVHPKFGQRVDVAALDVTEAVQGFQVEPVNVLEDDAVLDVVSSQDVFVVGFPLGLISGAPAPIWKRGTIALDPTFDPEELPKIFIDTTTREGMSGSVVIARHIIVGRGHLKKDGTTSSPVLYAKRDVVLGIYSGRHYKHLEQAQLGIVWKRRTIEDTVAQRRVADL